MAFFGVGMITHVVHVVFHTSTCHYVNVYHLGSSELRSSKLPVIRIQQGQLDTEGPNRKHQGYIGTAMVVFPRCAAAHK